MAGDLDALLIIGERMKQIRQAKSIPGNQFTLLAELAAARKLKLEEAAAISAAGPVGPGVEDPDVGDGPPADYPPTGGAGDAGK